MSFRTVIGTTTRGRRNGRHRSGDATFSRDRSRRVPLAAADPHRCLVQNASPWEA